MPDVASDPLNATSTAWLYQPLLSAPRAGVGVIVGGVPSYLNPSDCGAETLPALSRHVPDTLADAASGPPYVATVHDATPEVASVPATLTLTGWLYHPLTSGPRSAEIPVAVGGVASRLTVTSSRQHCVPETATVQVKVMPAVSELTVWLPQPCGLLEPAGRMNATVTSVVYQPVLQPVVTPPAVQVALIPSARAAAGSSSAVATSSATAASRAFNAPPHARRRRRARHSRGRARRARVPPAPAPHGFGRRPARRRRRTT